MGSFAMTTNEERPPADTDSPRRHPKGTLTAQIGAAGYVSGGPSGRH